MFRLLLTCVISVTMSQNASTQTPDTQPPKARIQPKKLVLHGVTRTDDYFWLRERDDPRVIAYLEAENRYTDAKMAHTKELRERLFEEIKGRIKQTDVSVPYRDRDYGLLLADRTRQAVFDPFAAKRPATDDAKEEVLLDVNEMATGHSFIDVRGRAISFGQQLMAYAVDTVGRRIYTVRFKDLSTGKILPDSIPAVTRNFVWANDDRTLFYTRQDPTTLRWHQVYRHTLGTDAKDDVLVYEEKDDTFEVSVSKTRSRKYILISSSQTLSDEYRYLDADKPTGEFQVFLPRRRNHEYGIDHLDGRFYTRTNDQAVNFPSDDVRRRQHQSGGLV